MKTLDLLIPTIEKSDTLAFSHVYQPIFSLEDQSVYGYEGLIRGAEIKNPQLLFEMAEKQKKLFNLDMSSILKCINSFSHHYGSNQENLHLTVNIFPSTLLEPLFLWFIDDLVNHIQFPLNRIIFELNEAETVKNFLKLKEVALHLRNLGFLIALDDLGKGQSSLRVALELEPDMVKLDQYFCVNLENSFNKQRFLYWISSYFKEIGSMVTLEGIETETQLSIAKQAGIQYGQGYHLGRPQPFMLNSFK